MNAQNKCLAIVSNMASACSAEKKPVNCCAF